MHITAEQIQKYINQFNITLENGLQFWAPYLINQNFTQNSTVPRGIGKSSADEIKASAEYVSELLPDIDSELLRQKLVDGSLPEPHMNYKGIDCSGFVYHVFSSLTMDAFGKPLDGILSVKKSNVLNGAFNFDEWRAAHTLSLEEAGSLPDDVPMTWIVETFKRNPRSLCGVSGLISSYTSIPIATISDVMPGDLLHTQSTDGTSQHIAIVVDCNTSELTFAHSTPKRPDDTGGVKIETVTIQQEDGQLVPKLVNFMGVYRLKLDQLAN